MKGIEVKNVTKTFQDTTALSQVSLNLEAGKYMSSRTERRREIHSFKSDNQRKFPDEGTITLDGATVAENDAFYSRCS